MNKKEFLERWSVMIKLVKDDSTEPDKVETPFSRICWLALRAYTHYGSSTYEEMPEAEIKAD